MDIEGVIRQYPNHVRRLEAVEAALGLRQASRQSAELNITVDDTAIKDLLADIHAAMDRIQAASESIRDDINARLDGFEQRLAKLETAPAAEAVKMPDVIVHQPPQGSQDPAPQESQPASDPQPEPPPADAQPPSQQ